MATRFTIANHIIVTVSNQIPLKHSMKHDGIMFDVELMVVAAMTQLLAEELLWMQHVAAVLLAKGILIVLVSQYKFDAFVSSSFLACLHQCSRMYNPPPTSNGFLTRYSG